MFERLRQEANLESLGFRRALRSAIVVFCSVILYQALSLTQGYWVTLTAVIVVQATVGATLRKSFQRFLGTLLGIIIASLLLLWVHNKVALDILVILFLFMTYFFNPFTNLINYGIVVIPLSISVVFLLALINPDKMNSGLVFARFYDTVIGASLGILGALFLFPNKVKHEFNTSKTYLEKQLADYFLAILNMFLNIPGSAQQAKAKKMLVEDALLADRQFYLERVYEIHFHFSKHEKERHFLELSEQLAQRLFSLHHMARYAHETELNDILVQIRDRGFEFLSQDEASEHALYASLVLLEKQLAESPKKSDNAILASLYFTVINLIDARKQAAYVR